MNWSVRRPPAQVLKLLDEVKAGRSVSPGSPSKKASLVASSVPGHVYTASTPPLSPRKSGGISSPFSVSPGTHNATKLGSPPIAIPQFYFPGAARSSAYKAAVDKVDAFFAVYPQGLSLDNLKALLKQVFSLPTSLAYPLFYKMTPGEEGLVSRASLISWLDRAGFWAQDAAGRAYRILCAPGATGVTPADLKPERYAETVIHCVFYALDRSGTGRLRLRELRRGDLLDALGEVDEQDDINRVSRYFSYEHFYVIYCKFWDLDTDHDFMLSRDDLLRYGNHALTFRIIERIFSQAARPFSTGNPAQMGYEDFVWFILSEEDKTTDTSLEYWFRSCDLDGDGVLHSSELYYFYEEQVHRMECLSQETVSFSDVMGQLHDMLNPENPSFYTLQDLKRNRLISGTLFNVLFNLNKFVQFETRDPFQARQEREEAGVSDWDRFARQEYMRLAVEDDADVDSVDAAAAAWGGSALEVDL
ncbi:hypothetical protein QBZ16_002466 [Prototheca wickerhamii]|uniref:EF-hand domain-containing protein n=1 Tax=Prototheca wickerhamii TaxID=3111 RepID=A0AAD9MLQ4_PROWI|nr:hypothetical protein QBZ16_002466 [Prototheca wickerhamii]